MNTNPSIPRRRDTTILARRTATSGLLGGAGVMRTFTQGGEGDNRISGNVGFGSRFYLGDWASINTEVRDYIYMETLQSGDTIHQDWVISLGLSMFIPTTYEYRYPK